jgi:hypothetical protein
MVGWSSQVPREDHSMLLGSRFRRLELVEHGLGGDVPGDLARSASASVLTPVRSAIAETIVTSLVTSCSASRLIYRSRSARLSAAAAMRFWLISTKVERKMASTDATIARTTNEGSQAGTPGIKPKLATIQKPKKARCR